MDPIENLPEDVVNHIMSYLNKVDILEMSMVSKHWYDFIGKSKQIMKNFIILYDKYNFGESIKPIMKSKRLYQNFKFSLENAAENPQIIQNMRSIINKFSGSIISIQTDCDIRRVLDLPKLKEVIFIIDDYLYGHAQSYNTRHLIRSYGILSKAKKLETLTIFPKLNKTSEKMLKKSLMKTDSLKKLTIGNASFLVDWKHEDYKFELESFKYNGFPEDQNAILSDFLKGHSSTLKEIDYNYVTYQDILFFLSNFPNLQKLTLRHNYNSVGNKAYPIHEKIKIFEIDNYLLDPSPFLQSFPNLESLKVQNLAGPVLDVIFQLKSIKAVQYQDLRDVTNAQRNLMTTNSRIKFISKRFYPY